MLGSAKPTASLSSGLLARKGQARPAMRPQGFVGLKPGTSLDDLGWNDMGEDGAEDALSPQAEAVVVTQPLNPAPTMPPVLEQREALAQEFAAQTTSVPSPARPVSAATADRIGRDVAAKQGTRGRAAFTLRLDRERHLKLRLASAVSGRSAQLLVTEALDTFLETLPEIGALASQLPTGKAR